MAHYQLSYGFNSVDNTTNSVTNTVTNSLKTKETTGITNLENQSKSIINDFNETSETEKRKLPQPSEPGKNKY